MLLLVMPVSAQDSMTVADCLLKSGYSTQVTARGFGARLAQMPGVNAWDGGATLRASEFLGTVDIATDTGPRMVRFGELNGELYAFVYKHPDDPGRRLPGEHPGVWHGDCFLRLNNG